MTLGLRLELLSIPTVTTPRVWAQAARALHRKAKGLIGSSSSQSRRIGIAIPLNQMLFVRVRSEPKTEVANPIQERLH